MNIVELQIAGFKSFADPVVLEIRDGLTGIVGPNGCGKSNIVDALRWVMGESSARGLRGGEMEDVLFAGAAWRPAADVAEVVLWIEGPVAGLVDAGERLRVARRLERGGSSRFTLDGREVRARDVQLLFADVASGSRSPAIVGQGQIVELVEWRPEDRRRLLEDAAGISGLLGRRREAQSRIAHTADNLARLADRIALLAERRSRLAGEARKAERFRRLQERKRFLERTALLVAYARVQAEHLQLCGELEALDGQLARLARRATRLDGLLRAREMRCRELGERSRDLERERARLEERERAARTAQERRRQEQARRETQRAELRRTEQEARRRLDDIAREERSLRRRLQQLQDRCDRLAAEQRQDQDQGPQLERRLREAREDDARQLARQRDVEATCERLRARLEAVRAREQELRRAGAAEERELSRRVDALRTELAAREREREQLAEAEREEEAQSRALAARLGELRDALDQARGEERRLREQLFARKLARKESELELRQLRQRIDELERACAKLGRDSERFRQEERKLTDLVASLREGREAGEIERLCAERTRVAVRMDVMRGRAAALRRLLARTREREQELERRIAALESEIRTRQEWAAAVPEHALLHRLESEAELASAVAALFGEELLAGLEPRGDAPFWRQLGDGGQDEPPAWPEGVEPLAPRIRAAPELGRLLKRVGLTSAERAARLQPALRPGEALVSPDGGLWRWDGFVRPPGCADHLSRCLGHEQRLAELRAKRTAAEAEHGRLARARALRERMLERAEERIAALGAEEDRIGGELAVWQRSREERVRRLRAAQEELARAAARRREAERLRAVRNTELERLQARLDALTERLGQLGTEQLEAEHAACSSRIRELEARATAAARELADRTEQQRARMEALRRLEERCAVLRGELAALAKRREELEHLEARVEAERAALAAERQALSGRLRDIEKEAARSRALRERAQARVREAERALREWEERCRRRARAREEAVAETERLGRHLERIAGERRRGEAWCRELAQRLSELDGEETVGAEEDPDAWAGMRVRIEEQLQAANRALARERERCLELRRRVECMRERRGALAERRKVLEARRREAEVERSRTEELLRRRLGGLPRDDEEGRLELEALLASWPLERIEAERERVERLLARIGTVNLVAARELEEVVRELDALEAQRSELAAASARLERAARRLEREARERLLAMFREVDGRFRDLFRRLFGGGEARLSWVGEEDPLRAGVELLVRPPGKRLQRLSLLSGGEKSLAALALLFAFQQAHPPPLCVFDEVDAALDDANVARFVGLMKELARERGLRFLVVTHHPYTMGHMDRLFGVTMGERGVSRVLSLALSEALALRATA